MPSPILNTKIHTTTIAGRLVVSINLRDTHVGVRVFDREVTGSYAGAAQAVSLTLLRERLREGASTLTRRLGAMLIGGTPCPAGLAAGRASLFTGAPARSVSGVAR